MTATDQRIAITIEATDDPVRHVIRFNRGIQPTASIPLTQGEMIDLWQKIGAYFNLAGMGKHGERTHTHTREGQTLRHAHDGGSQPHGYYGHAEDYQPHVWPGELYNGELLTSHTPTPTPEED